MDKKRRKTRFPFREVPIPKEIGRLVEPGARAYIMGKCQIIVGHSSSKGWHLSISHPKRYPTWEEIKKARYCLAPDDVTMAMLLPPQSEYVNIETNTFHLWQVPGDTGVGR